jgi:hypothetical protein
VLKKNKGWRRIVNKGLMVAFLSFIMFGLLLPNAGMCRDVSNEEIMEELKTLKARVNELEENLDKKDQEIEKLKKERIRHTDLTNVTEDMGSQKGLLDKIKDRISISGLVEAGAAYKVADKTTGTDEDSSDINLTTVELGVAVEVNDWVNLGMVFLYEDPFENDEEDNVNVDVGTITFGNTEKYPLYLSAGKMYVPFGALLTHLPDDPLVDQPMTLLFGETSEKAVLVGFEHSGFAVSGYAFNGDMDSSAEDNSIESFGFDANCTAFEDSPIALLVGASYISNISDSDGLTDYLQDDDHPSGAAVEELEDYVAGFAAYLHLGYNDFFLDAEYMTALDKFDPSELATESGDGAEPSAWNIEAGYNWDWGKNLEIVLKYAGSDETEALGFPGDRYGICFNQEIVECIIASVAYFRDEFHIGDANGNDDGNTVFGQIAVGF